MDLESIKPIIYVVSYIIVLGGIPVFLTRNKNRGILLPFCLGIFLGPIGWLIAAFMKPPLSQETQDKLSRTIENKKSVHNEWMQD